MQVSFHKYGDFFPGTGALADTGHSGGHNYSVNVPLQEGMDDESYCLVFEPVMQKVPSLCQLSGLGVQVRARIIVGSRSRVNIRVRCRVTIRVTDRLQDASGRALCLHILDDEYCRVAPAHWNAAPSRAAAPCPC